MEKDKINIDNITSAAMAGMKMPIGMGNDIPVNVVTAPSNFVARNPAQTVAVNDDAKTGKALQVARKTYEKFKVETIENFLSLVDEIKNNL